jgi:hypothetical protein
VALPRISNLHAVSTLDSSTPAASTMSFIISDLHVYRFLKKLQFSPPHNFSDVGSFPRLHFAQ